MPLNDRLRHLRSQLEPHRLDAVLITHLPNIRYLCGFTGSAGVLAITDREAIFFTDGRYSEQARAEVQGAKTTIRKGKSGMVAALDWVRTGSGIRRIGIESSSMTVAEKDVITRPRAQNRQRTPNRRTNENGQVA